MRTYFKNVNTLQELRKQYRDLLKQYHPDNKGGSEEATKEINVEYDKLFKILKDKHENSSADSKTESSNNKTYDFEEDEKLREVLNKIISFADITIEIIGSWIWVDGNSYQ